MIVTPDGRCVCALEKGLIIDEYGRCVCPVEHGYRLDRLGNCKPVGVVECLRDDECADDKYCEDTTKTCEDPCVKQTCASSAVCTATRHRAICTCIQGYTGDGYTHCDKAAWGRTDFPKPEMGASCLSDGVQLQIQVHEQGFDGVLYVKGHSNDDRCRRVLSIPAERIPTETMPRTETFKVAFGECGLIHVNVSFKFEFNSHLLRHVPNFLLAEFIYFFNY